jgi:predicted nucleotidyltransferase
MDERTLRDCPVLTLVTDLGDLDVMDRVAGVGDYPAVRAASVEADLAGVRARVLALNALIAAKRAAGRRKDQETLLELEALREERRRRGM